MNKSLKRKNFSLYKISLILNDVSIALLAYFTLTSFLFDITGSIDQMVVIGLMAVVTISFFNTCKLYNYHIIYRRIDHIKRLLKAFVWGAFILCISLFFFVWSESIKDIYLVGLTIAIAAVFIFFRRLLDDYSLELIKAVGISFILVGILGLLKSDPVELISSKYEVLPAAFIISAIVICVSRYLIVHHLFGRVMKKTFRRQVALIGDDKHAEEITEYIIENNATFWVCGVVGTDSGTAFEVSIKKDNLGELNNLPNIIEKHNISEIILTNEKISKQALISILDYCTSMGINVWFPPNYMPVIAVKLYIDSFCGLPMIRLCTQKNSWLFNKLKYSFDAIFTLPVFILHLPIFLSITAAIKLTSPGSIFYKARAIGRGGIPFSMLKFRSMREDSDNTVHKEFVTKLIKGKITAGGDTDKPLKITNDDRVTTIGKIIRKYSLDELPQLINVLKGEMSLVGPRPCLPYEYEVYEDWHKKRTAVRPGISGLWQVTGRSEVSFEDMLLLDLYYIYNRSFSMDISILFETVFVVFNKKGAY